MVPKSIQHKYFEYLHNNVMLEYFEINKTLARLQEQIT